MTVSPLAAKTIQTNNCYSPRQYKITKFTPHHMASNLTAEQCANIFLNPNRQASSNYCIGTDGTIVCSVPEENAAWTSSSYDNDNRAITVEVANTSVGVANGTWEVSDAAWNSLVKLAVDICRRYNFRLYYTGDSSGSLTEHRMFAATNCPGPYLHDRMDLLARTVNNLLDGEDDDEVSAVDLWGYKNKDQAGNKDAYQLICDIHQAVTTDVHPSSDVPPAIANVAYKNKSLNGDKDVYQLITDIANGMTDMKKQITTMKKDITTIKKNLS